MIGLLLDLGNVAITIANIPQILTAMRNRRNLQGLSAGMLVGYMVAADLFLVTGLLAGGYLTVALCSFNQAFYAVQLYWKLKYGRQQNG